MDGFTVQSENTSGSNSLRNFSSAVVASIRDCIRLQLLATEHTSVASLQADLAVLQTEASFYGFPATARLARKTRAFVGSLESWPPASNEHRELTLASLSMLVTLVDEPCNASLAGKVDGLCVRLDDHSDCLQLASIEPVVFQFGMVNPSQASSKSHAVARHADLDIYSSDVMDGMERCSDEESWIVTQLASAAEDLAGRRSDIRPAHKLMSVLRGHRFFQHMDRVCIVGLVPEANQLVVVDSCIHDRLKDQGIKNRMPRGYSCFVNPQGSLFQMKPGVLRIFADSQTVLESFAKNGRPAQRSIAYVAESGLRSGICLAIGRGETVQGYLFMNSYQPNLFDHVMRDYAPLLSLFSLMGTVALDAAGFHAVEGEFKAERMEAIPKHSQVFSIPQFKSWVERSIGQQIAGRCTVEIVADASLGFLYLPRVMVAAIAELACRTGLANVGTECHLRLMIHQEGEELVIELDRTALMNVLGTSLWLEESVSEIKSRHVNRPLSMGIKDNNVLLRFPYEPVLASNSEVLYSVAY